MKTHSFLKFKKDIENLLNYKLVEIEEVTPTVRPVFQRINDDMPYLTEEKIEDAYLNDKISQKTLKLLEWLAIKENLDVAENIYLNNKQKYEEISCLLESVNCDFITFIRNLIKKHEQAISSRE
jgi:hypothetical protein